MVIWVTLFPTHGRGDVLLLTPALRRLRQVYPKAKIACLVNHAELLLHNQDVDFVSGNLSPRDLHPSIRPSNDDLWFHVDYRSQCVPGLDRHIVDVICEFCGVSSTSYVPILVLKPAERQRGQELVKNFFDARPESIVAIHCRASAVNREWPHLNWTELIRQFPNTGFIQVGGREDEVVEGVSTACGQWSLRETAAAIAACDAVVAIDSWVQHAAAAVKTPGVVIFGSTAPEAFGDAMHTNLARRVECGPCYRPALWADDYIEDPLQPGIKAPWICPERICFELVTSAIVEDALRKVLVRRVPFSTAAAQ